MADLRSEGTNNNLNDGKVYTSEQEFVDSVDLSAWDLATNCGSCHVGGGLTAAGKDGVPYAQRPEPTPGEYNAYDYTVAEYWMADGSPAHYVNDIGMNWHLNSDGSVVDTDTNSATGKFAGFAPQRAFWKYPYPLPAMGAPNFMMPNVRELDCMFCHMEGYNNIISSVAVQMGALNAAPSMGAGLLNMFTQAYIPGVVETMPITHPVFGEMNVAYLPGSTVSRIKGNPPSDNCRLCHSPTTMENFSDMFDKFLAASPMSFEPGNPMAGPTGLAMPAYDLNAPFIPQGDASPIVYGQPDGSWIYADGTDAGGPFGGMFPMALFPNYRQVSPTNPALGEMGGNSMGGTGPIYFAGGDTMDQGALKKAVVPFPRADFFKRGDIWDNATQEVHHSLECAGCHMDTSTLNGDKSQCDPGRGYARLGGVESGFNGGPDSRNTVKRCENCHITGKNNDGVPIQTFGAKIATAAHEAAGLTAKITNAVGANGTFKGDHLDIIDCSVCHMNKVSMAVRALDCTSGNRYPTVIGFEENKGMLGMFTDPMGLKDVPADQFQEITGLPYPKEMYVNEMQNWTPLKGWWQNGSKFLEDGTTPNPDYRRKIYNINMITAILWDNNGTFDANGDTATGAAADAAAPAGALGFDPWIQRDLKVGMNFADTGFAPVPVGFGDPMAPGYGSAYDAQGKFTGAWDYVGIYGGNVIFTNPDQINAYKSMRTSMNGAKPWDDTKLTIFGGPFQVTHNTVDTNTAVLGKGGNCNDCHDAASGFFSGSYDMTGSAVPASATFDYGDGNGPQPTGMMERPVVDYEIIADGDDLITGAEAQSKDGVVHEVEFEQHGCYDGTNFVLEGVGTCGTATHVRTVDMSRSEFLYFDAADAHAKAANMEVNRTLADYVAAPVAVISSVPASVEVGSTVSLVADETVNPVGTPSYSWICNDTAGEVLEGSTASKTFNSVGTWTVTLKVINADGDLDQVSQQVQVTAPAPLADIALVAPVQPAGTANSVSFSNLPTHTMLYIIWGDGLKQRVYDTSASVDVAHTFRMYSKYFDGSNYNYRTTVYVYNGSSRVDVKREILSIAP